MARLNIDSAAYERMKACRHQMSGERFATLIRCLRRLKAWNPKDATISISNDYDNMSFFFRETYADGRTGLCGGILFHGPRDGYGSGGGPTFAVTLNPTDGYSIHT